VDFLGDDPVKTLKEEPEKILQTPKVKLELLETVKNTFLENSVVNEILIVLRDYDISMVNALKIFNRYGKKSIGVIKNNPYVLSYEVSGIGFILADKIALSFGFDRFSKIRITEAIKYTLNTNSSYGSSYMLKDEVICETNKLLCFPLDSSYVKDVLINSNDFSVLDINGENRYYSKELYDAEHNIRNCILNLLNGKVKILKGVKVNKDGLSDDQRKAVEGALKNPISILTGGPGCGKTFSTKTIIKYIMMTGKKYAICAPTGRAAMRSSEIIGCEAYTIHRLLEYNPGYEAFTKNEDNPLNYEYIIVEESSMIDIRLMSSLLSAVSPNTQILFVGDHDQLPPIGPGSPFKDMIDVGIIPVYKLTTIFRQALDSNIITYAHAINKGEKVEIDSPIYNPKVWDSKVDCLFIDSDLKRDGENKCSQYSTLRYGFDIIETIVKLYSTTIKKYKNYTDIQILIPMRVGKVGTNTINHLIQEVVNPLVHNKEINIGAKRFRLNDKVIHTQNNYNLDVFNGEIGIITEIDSESLTCSVQYPTKLIKYDKKDIVDLELAYAITIHKAQGCEFECVILPLLKDYGRMLQRQLVYTALTRAKKMAIFIGSKHALNIAIHTSHENKRKTSLKELIMESQVQTA
jgi:exodeoxyribonuclease V alpha subunit